MGQQCRKCYRNTRQYKCFITGPYSEQEPAFKYFGGEAHTNSHHNQEPRAEPPKIHHCTPCALHKIIRIRTSPAYPVRQWCNYVGSYDEQGQVAVEKGGGEDDEEEANGEDLSVFWRLVEV